MRDWFTTETEIRASQLSARDWLRLLWGASWRGLLLALPGALLGLGLSSRAALGALYPTAAGALLSLAVGLPLYVRWLFHARFGSLRLALIRTPPDR